MTKDEFCVLIIDDNDGDATTDFPDEPGCASPLDDDETDPDPLPECANGVDDDGDDLADYPDDEQLRVALAFSLGPVSAEGRELVESLHAPSESVLTVEQRVYGSSYRPPGACTA